MRSRLLQLRLWLEKNGVFPRSRLALITCYLLALGVFLFVVEKVAGWVHGDWGGFLGIWVDLLSIAVIILLGVLARRWVSARMLWRVRNRLVATHLFIGVVPLVLLVVLAGLAVYLFTYQFATYIVVSRLNSELKAVQARNEVLVRAISADLGAGHKPDIALQAGYAATDSEISAWLGNELLFNSSGSEPPTTVPAYLPARFSGIVRDRARFFLRSAIASAVTNRTLIVVSNRPLDSRLLLELSQNLGEVTFFEQDPKTSTRTPKLSVGTSPAPRRMFDLAVTLPTDVAVTNWTDGQPFTGATISVRTRLSELYGHLFSAAGVLAHTIEGILLALAIVLGIFEMIALSIGNRLTRSVTGAVEQLYRATTHVNRGDFSHRIPLTSDDQLAALAKSFNGMTASLERLIREQKEKQRLENEISIAQEVQAQLFPQRIRPIATLEVHGFCRPARSVSGDYYDFVRLGSDRMILAVGDVSGKGISAALLMATIHSAVRAYSIEGIPVFRQAEAVGAGLGSSTRYDPIIPGAEASPGTLLALLNHQLYHSTPIEKYATMFLAYYDGSERKLTFSNAGHLPPLLLSTSGSIRRLEDGGTVVGLFDDMNYAEGTVQLHPGDIFLAYSDGVTEPENEFGEFGESRLIELVQENRDLPLDRIAEVVTAAVDDWIGGAEQPDDVTLVLARAG
jgi:sigma-B regulation protein RsbU (phosphoserine phosphatase)